MKLADAEARLDDILNKGLFLQNIDQFITDLLNDTELSPREKYDLLKKVSIKSGRHIGQMILDRLSEQSYIPPQRLFTRIQRIKNYLSILGHIGTALPIDPTLLAEIVQFLNQPGDPKAESPSIIQLIAMYENAGIIQHLLTLLKDLSADDKILGQVLASLNIKNSRSGFRTFFEEMKFRQILVDISEFNQLMTSFIRQRINTDYLDIYPHVCIAQLLSQDVIALDTLIKLLPPDHYGYTLKTVASAVHWTVMLSRHMNDFMMLTQWNNNSDDPINLSINLVIDNHSLTELNLLIAIIESLNLGGCEIFSSIEIISDLQDERMIAILAALFRNTRVLKFKDCEISQRFMRILSTAQDRLGVAYPIKKITLNSVETDKTLLVQLKEWLADKATIVRLELEASRRCKVSAVSSTFSYPRPELVINDIRFAAQFNTDCALLLRCFPPNSTKKVILQMSAQKIDSQRFLARGLVIIDPGVTELTLRDMIIIDDMLKHNDFLRFLSGMTGLTSLTFGNMFSLNSFYNAIHEALAKPGLAELVMDAPLNDAHLDFIIKLLPLNKHLTRLCLPKSRFSETALQRLAQIFDYSNHTLSSLTLASDVVLPKQLVSALDKNADRNEYAKSSLTVRRLLEKVTRFAETVNQNTPQDQINGCWQDLHYANQLCENFKIVDYDTRVATKALGESLAITYSYFLVQTRLNCENLSEHDWADTHVLQNMFRYFIENPETLNICFKNLLIYCDSFYKKLNARRLNELTQANDATSKHVAYGLHEELLKKILLYIQQYKTLYFREIDEMLFSLLQRKIRHILPQISDRDIALLAKNINASTQISDLLNHCNDFLNNLEILEQLSLKARKLMFNPSSDAGLMGDLARTRPYFPCDNLNQYGRTEIISNLDAVYTELQRIIKTRQLPVYHDIQLFRPLAELRPIPVIEYLSLPPASFVGGKDKADLKEVEINSAIGSPDSQSHSLMPPSRSELQPPAPGAANPSDRLLAQASQAHDNLDWLGVDGGVPQPAEQSEIPQLIVGSTHPGSGAQNYQQRTIEESIQPLPNALVVIDPPESPMRTPNLDSLLDSGNVNTGVVSPHIDGFNGNGASPATPSLDSLHVRASTPSQFLNRSIDELKVNENDHSSPAASNYDLSLVIEQNGSPSVVPRDAQNNSVSANTSLTNNKLSDDSTEKDETPTSIREALRFMTFSRGVLQPPAPVAVLMKPQERLLPPAPVALSKPQEQLVLPDVTTQPIGYDDEIEDSFSSVVNHENHRRGLSSVKI